MPASRRLMRRFAGVFALAGAALCLALVFVALALKDRLVEEELTFRAAALAATFERAAAAGVAPLALARLSDGAGITDLALIDQVDGRVVAASRSAWVGQPADVLPREMSGSETRLRATGTPGTYAMALPLVLDPSDGRPRHILALRLDGGPTAPARLRALQSFAVASLLGILMLGLAAWWLFGRWVLTPLNRIHQDQEATVRRYGERLQLAVAGSNDALFDYDPRHGTLYLSDVFDRWMGGSPDDEHRVALQAEEVLERIQHDHAHRVRSAFLTCAESGRSFDVEFQMRRPDGGLLWVQARGRGVLQKHGLYRVSGFASDISHRKVAERLLRDTVDRLAAVLDNIAEGIVTLNGSGEICAVNAAARQMFRIDGDAAVGRPLAELLALPADGNVGWQDLADRQPREAPVVPVRGEAFSAEFAVSTMRVNSDERFIVVLRDVTERKVADDRLRTAMEQAQAATRTKDEFLATMSHEIRTPMNGVLGMTQLLLDMDLSQQQRETAQLIRSSGEALLTIINDILDFSRAGSGQMKVDSAPFDLRQTVREVVELLGRRSTVDLYVDYPLELPGALVGDPGRVRQVLMNLVGNAQKFTEQGHVVVKVARRSPVAEPDDGVARLEIAVEDTGPGIPEEARASLFEPFTQADASTTRRFGGTGLGLAISRRLVELMGGEIAFDTEPGQGSRFRFSLDLPMQTARSAVTAPAVLAGKRVLVVNDDLRGLEIFSRCLAAAGMEVTAAAAGPAALELLEQQRFDVAVIDDRMPDMDGLLLCELIRVDRCWRDMRMVLLCAGDARGIRDSNAMDHCLVRPVMPEHLLQCVATLLCAATGEPLRAPVQAERAPTDAATAPRSPALRVLLAEDNLVNQKVAVRMLEKSGCAIDVAGDGSEALEMWQHFRYDAIFMDCQMPQLDGLEAARQIRREESRLSLARTPIIAMTANAMDRDRGDCLAAGMDDYLSKPVNQADLIQALLRWAGGDSTRQVADRAGRGP